MLADMRIDVAAATDTGRHRSTNADAFLIDEQAGLLAVADGMGDTPRSGAVAKMALAAVCELFTAPWSQLPCADRCVGEAAERLVLGVMQANGRLFLDGRGEKRRCGSTFAGVIVCRDHLCVGSAGDSRVYLFRPGTTRIVRLTEDDTVANEGLRRGEPYDIAVAKPKARALTRAIGLQRSLDLRPMVTRWAPGDIVLVCTDGVTDWIDDATIARTLVEYETLDTAAHRVLERALASGGRDNATVVLARWRT